jgi:hypothetical protein
VGVEQLLGCRDDLDPDKIVVMADAGWFLIHEGRL